MENNPNSFQLPPEIQEKLLREYKDSIPDKLTRIHRLIDALNVDFQLDTLKLLRIEIHKIAGSSGTYGFIQVSNICIPFDQDLLDKIKEFELTNEITADWPEEFAEYVKQIEEAFKIEE